jgi:hypothetical protein
MQVKTIRLPKSEVFPCSRRDVKVVFDPDELEWVSFGNPIRTFSFDSRATGVPKLSGPVVLSLAISRERTAHLCVFPIPYAKYPEKARGQMVESVLPRFAQWLRAKQRQSTTAVLGHEQIVAEWDGKTHRYHELRFL